jgi:hypothetical protein
MMQDLMAWVLMERNLVVWVALVAWVWLASIQVVGSQTLPIEQVMERLGMVSGEECRRLCLLCRNSQFCSSNSVDKVDWLTSLRPISGFLILGNKGCSLSVQRIANVQGVVLGLVFVLVATTHVENSWMEG